MRARVCASSPNAVYTFRNSCAQIGIHEHAGNTKHVLLPSFVRPHSLVNVPFTVYSRLFVSANIHVNSFILISFLPVTSHPGIKIEYISVYADEASKYVIMVTIACD